MVVCTYTVVWCIADPHGNHFSLSRGKCGRVCDLILRGFVCTCAYTFVVCVTQTHIICAWQDPRVRWHRAQEEEYRSCDKKTSNRAGKYIYVQHKYMYIYYTYYIHIWSMLVIACPVQRPGTQQAAPFERNGYVQIVLCQCVSVLILCVILCCVSGIGDEGPQWASSGDRCESAALCWRGREEPLLLAAVQFGNHHGACAHTNIWFRARTWLGSHTHTRNVYTRTYCAMLDALPCPFAARSALHKRWKVQNDEKTTHIHK